MGRGHAANISPSHSLIEFVPDRPGHDRRYSIDTAKLRGLGWQPEHTFESALAATVDWYVQNESWWRKLKSGEYLDYYRRNYRDRQASLEP